MFKNSLLYYVGRRQKVHSHSHPEPACHRNVTSERGQKQSLGSAYSTSLSQSYQSSSLRIPATEDRSFGLFVRKEHLLQNSEPLIRAIESKCHALGDAGKEVHGGALVKIVILSYCAEKRYGFGAKAIQIPPGLWSLTCHGQNDTAIGQYCNYGS